MNAVISMKVKDYFTQGRRGWVRLHEKGGKEKDLGKKEHQLFGEDGLESTMDRVASIEMMLGIYELAQFTPRI